MKEYDVIVELREKLSFKVETLDETDALNMVKDIIENGDLKDIEERENEIFNINIRFNNIEESEEKESDFTIPFSKVQK